MRRGLWLALALGLLFLAGTAVQSVATLLARMRSDTMKAATGGMWSGQIGREVLYFLAAQLVLHLAFGLLAWSLAWLTTVVRPAARERFGRVVVLWFCVLAAAVIAYDATWFTRTGLGVYYHNAPTTRAWTARRGTDHISQRNRCGHVHLSRGRVANAAAD